MHVSYSFCYDFIVICVHHYLLLFCLHIIYIVCIINIIVLCSIYHKYIVLCSIPVYFFCSFVGVICHLTVLSPMIHFMCCHFVPYLYLLCYMSPYCVVSSLCCVVSSFVLCHLSVCFYMSPSYHVLTLCTFSVPYLYINHSCIPHCIKLM